jgi:hypothetical protein
MVGRLCRHCVQCQCVCVCARVCVLASASWLPSSLQSSTCVEHTRLKLSQILHTSVKRETLWFTHLPVWFVRCPSTFSTKRTHICACILRADTCRWFSWVTLLPQRLKHGRMLCLGRLQIHTWVEPWPQGNYLTSRCL